MTYIWGGSYPEAAALGDKTLGSHGGLKVPALSNTLDLPPTVLQLVFVLICLLVTEEAQLGSVPQQ